MQSRSLGVVEVLLEREEVNSGPRDNLGRTALMYGACGGNPEVVRLILARKEVDPGLQDTKGKTALAWATDYGREEVAELLRAWTDQ